MIKRAMTFGLMLSLLAAPLSARQWKPNPQQLALDYAIIVHVKPNDGGRVTLQWVASSTNPSPMMQQLLDKYVVISIIHTRTAPGGMAVWDDVQGVTVTDGDGNALKEVPQDAIPPALVGMFASADAMMRQSTQGKAKARWGVYETGNVHACIKGKLLVSYDGETYAWDTPMPGCPKN